MAGTCQFLKTFGPSLKPGRKCVQILLQKRLVPYIRAPWRRTAACQKFSEMADSPHRRQAWHPEKLVTFQVMRRTVGTDLQKHGTMKDAQQILRHANIQTTGNVYLQHIPTSVMEAINSRTRAILTTPRQVAGESSNAMGSNGLQLENGVFVSA